MPTVGHSFDESDVICIDSDDDDIDVGGPEGVSASKVQPKVEDMSW
jgi:hypothetical protein